MCLVRRSWCRLEECLMQASSDSLTHLGVRLTAAMRRLICGETQAPVNEREIH